MTRSEIYETMNKVFRDVFDDETITVEDTTTSKDIAGWDSLMQITLVSEVEDAFGLHFPMRDIALMNNVGDMVDAIENKLNQ